MRTGISCAAGSKPRVAEVRKACPLRMCGFGQPALPGPHSESLLQTVHPAPDFRTFPSLPTRAEIGRSPALVLQLHSRKANSSFTWNAIQTDLASIGLNPTRRRGRFDGGRSDRRGKYHMDYVRAEYVAFGSAVFRRKPRSKRHSELANGMVSGSTHFGTQEWRIARHS